ncbi:MAG: type II toxin-antitoxin system VapC family toxin [Caulobacteraceae bacterium]
MKITPDANLFVRLFADDDRAQRRLAERTLEDAELVAITLPALCELAWVLTRSYRVPRADVAGAIRGLVDIANVVVDRPAVEAGLALLDRGGDFADGVIAHQGYELGGDVFVSFDRKAVGLVEAVGEAALLLG